MQFVFALLLSLSALCGHSLAIETPCHIAEDDAICKVEGNHFVETFDGLRYEYEFCTHILVQNQFNNKWSIRVVKNKNDGLTGFGIQILQNNKVLYVNGNLNGFQYQGFTYTLSQANVIGRLNEEFSFERRGYGLLFKSKLYGFWFEYDYINKIKIGVPPEMSNKVQGLCGKYNGRPSDDTTTPDGKIVTESRVFGDSWKIPGTTCPFNPICSVTGRNISTFICSSLSDQGVLSKCKNVVDVDYCLDNCVSDMCTCLMSKSVELCLCEAKAIYARKCKAQLPTLDLSQWRSEAKCPAPSCPVAGMTWQDCYPRKCEPSCDNLHIKDSCPVAQNTCQAGCFCPEGLVKKSNSECVRPEQCRNCVCQGYTDPHYKTFDGTTFAFQGECTYVASKANVSTTNAQRWGIFEVWPTNVKCGKSVTCANAITVIFNNQHYIHVEKNKNQLRTIVNGATINNFPMKNTWLTLESEPGRFVTIFIPQIQLEVTFNFRGFSIKTSSSVFPRNSLQGLCGNCNNDKFDDLMKPNGVVTTNVNDFGMSWWAEQLFASPGVGDECGNKIPAPPTAPSTQCQPGYPLPASQDPCMAVLDKTKFGQCHALVDPTPYVEACQFDMCHSTERAGIACDVTASYADACRSHSLCINWRTPDFCPYTCPAGKVYSPCGSGCEATCSNYRELLAGTNTCNLDKREGCFCPAGQVSTANNKCINTAQCKTCYCQAFGDPHFTSFDKKKFDFQGTCTYVASRDKVRTGGSHSYQVLITAKNYPEDLTVSYTMAVTVLYDSHVVHLARLSSGEDASILLDKDLVTSSSLKNDWVQIEKTKGVIMVYIAAINLQVTYWPRHWLYAVQLSPGYFSGTLEGLCGNCNDNVNDDYMLRDGKVVTDVNTFGMNWLVTDLPPGVPLDSCKNVTSPPPLSNKCKPGYPLPAGQTDPCDLLRDVKKFGECHAVIDPADYIAACKYDMCHQSERGDVACSALSAYVAACRGKGICLDWRTKDVCPYNCPAGTVYSSCGSGCTTTCDNYQRLRTAECNVEQTEGCFCPPGQVFQGNVCVPESECRTCPAPPTCKPCEVFTTPAPVTCATCPPPVNEDCKLHYIPASESVGRFMFTVTENNVVHRRCINTERTAEYTYCSGVCGHGLQFYNNQAGVFMNDGQRCGGSTYKSYPVAHRCEDGFIRNIVLYFPTSCQCHAMPSPAAGSARSVSQSLVPELFTTNTNNTETIVLN